MFTFLKEAHNKIGMILLFLLLIVVLFILFQYIFKKSFKKSARIAALIGFFLYFLSPLGVSNFSGESMGQEISRFYIIEHPVGMILAAVLITIGYKAAKNNSLSDKGKFNRVLIYYGIGFAITAKMIPWFLWS